MFLEILLLFGLQHSTEKFSQSNLQKLTLKGGSPKKYDEKDDDDGDDDYEQQFEQE